MNFIDELSVKILYNHINERSKLKAPLIADDVYEIIMKVSHLNLYACVFDLSPHCLSISNKSKMYILKFKIPLFR